MFDLSIVEEFLTNAWTMSYDWPGNVRELQSRLRNLLLGHPYDADRVPSNSGVPLGILNATMSESEVKTWYQDRVLTKHQQNYADAARVLGISRGTIYNRGKNRE